MRDEKCCVLIDENMCFEENKCAMRGWWGTKIWVPKRMVCDERMRKICFDWWK